MASSMAASARSRLAELEEDAEDAYVLLAEAGKESQTPLAHDSKELLESLERMSVALKLLSLRLRRLDDPEREVPPPPGPYDLGRLVACQDALSDLAQALRTRTSSSIDPDHIARAHWIIENTLTNLQIALPLSRYSLVLGVLSGQPQAPPARRPSATAFPAFITIRIPEQSRPGHRILDALCSTDHSTARALDLLDSRCPGTAEWIFTAHSGVKDWMQGKHPLLHLSGLPGCGKSVIAAAIVNQLAQKATTPTSSLCYFLVDPRMPSNPATILGTLLAQIMAQSLQAYSAAEALFAIPEEESDGSTTRALQFHQNPLDGEPIRWVHYKDPQVLAEILRAAMRSFSKNYVVIDGIDHLLSEDQNKLVRLLCTLDWRHTQILIMSRPIELEMINSRDRIAQEWEYNCCPVSASSDDLRIFIKKTTDKLALQQLSGQALPQPLRPEFLDATADSLAESQNFQYVQYQLWYLRIQDSTEGQSPCKLPLPQSNSWDSTYAAMIDAIIERESKFKGLHAKSSETNISDLRSAFENALSWFLLSAHTRPGHFTGFTLSKRSFFEAVSLALAPDAESLQELEPASDLEARFGFYFDAFVVEKTTTVPLGLAGLGTSKTSAPVTQYSHRHWTFIEYLITLGHGDVPNMNLERASTSLALVALRYVGFAEFKRPVGEIKLLQKQAYERRIHHPFYSLAAGWLPEMLRGADWTKLTSRIQNLFDPTDRDSTITIFLEYVDYHFPWVYELTSLSHTPSALVELVDELATGRLSAFHIAVTLGLSDVCRRITSVWRKSDMAAVLDTTTAYGSPLALALLGPRAFAISDSETWRDFFVPLRQGQTSVSSIDVRGTIFYLLGQHASCPSKFPSRAGEGLSSLGPSALMRCAFLGDADLFICLMKAAKIRPPTGLDSTFIQVLNDIFFPDLGSHATPAVLYNTLARYQLRSLSPDSRVFLDKVCEYVMDRQIDLVLSPPEPQEKSESEEEDSDMLLAAAWNCAFRYGLACARFSQEPGDPETARRPIGCSDQQYSQLRESNLREFQPYQMLRLMQDPRWDVNQPLENRGSETQDENAGQTALHVTVENEGEVAYMLAKLLIRSGANVAARDARGRTPLHVAEGERMLKLLLDNGAESRAQDSDGRTVWHVAAANNDARTLRELVKWHRPESEMLVEALRCVAKQGRTPLAEAIAFFHERPRWVNVQFPELVEHAAADVILPLCKGDPLTFQSDVPLVHLAAEWGRETILAALDEAGAIERGVLTAGNETPFHFLNVGASQSFIETLGRVYGTESLALLSSSGKSAAEAFMDRLAELAPPSSDASNPQPQAAEQQQVDAAVFQTLLVPAVVRSKDSEGLTFWERFCYKILAAYCHTFRESQSAAVDTLFRFIEVLNETDAIKFHEEQTQATAFLPLAKAVWTKSKFIPPWFSMPCLAVLLKTGALGAAGTDESVILTLKWAISSGKSRLMELLLQRGASVHAPARGQSVLEEFHRYDMPMFQIVLQHADKDKLNTLNKHGRAPIHNLVGELDASDRRGSGTTGRSAKIAALVNAGADVDLLTDDRMSPVILAAMKSNQESAKTLLDLGADTSITLPDGLDISLAASSRGCVQILRKLMNLKDFPARNWARRFSITVSLAKEAWKKRIYQGCHALHIAALNCQVGSLRFYLEEKLIPIGDPCFDHRMTALHFAAIGGASDAIRYLVSQGAEINARDVTGLTPLHVGVQARHPDSVRTLLQLGADKTLRDREGRTPLLLAIQWNVHLCYNLLKGDAQAEASVDSKQSTEGQASSPARTAKGMRHLAEALENSVMTGDMNALCFVLKDGCPADSTMPSCGECSALGLAVWAAKHQVAKYLLDKGARRFTMRCQKHTFAGISALFQAAVPRPQAPPRPQALPHCLKLLLNAALKDGINWFNAHFTPLHIAVQQTNPSAVALVLKHLASNSAAYRKWLPAVLPSGPRLPAAVTRAHQSLAAPRYDPVVREIVNRQVTLLFADDEYHMEPTTALHMAVMGGSVDIMRMLFDRGGADVNGVDWELSTPLHRAVRNEYEAGIRLLLERGALTNTRDRDGYTPLMRAARAGRVDLCKLLITEGAADPTVRDLDGMTLLSCCAEKSSSPALFDYLSGPEVGLDAYARDKTTYSPLHDAILNLGMTAYVFSGRWDFERVARGVDLPKGFFSLIVDGGDGRCLLPRLRGRWPRTEWSRYVNACPPRYLSPLCLAAAKGLLWELNWLLHRGGADPELEGSAEGTPLMTACAHGREEAVKMLVRSGARVAYVKPLPGGDGAVVVQNALAHAKKFPHIARWLLVERYTDQGKIADRPHDAAAAAEFSDGSGKNWPPGSNDGLPGIGRVLQVRYLLVGTNREYGRMHKEPLRKYIRRAAEIKLSLRGKVVVPYTDPV